MRNPRRPLGSEEETALGHLEAYAKETEEEGSLTLEGAVSYLKEQGMHPADARDCIEQLLKKGFLYEVDGELRIPPRI